MEVWSQGAMSEIQIKEIVASSDAAEELRQFHPSLQVRINDILSGLSPNGEHPDSSLDVAVTPPASLSPEERQEAEKTFIGEYSWALALSVYPYKDDEGLEALMLAAEDGLFAAAETYDPETEPNFLRHLSEQVRGYLTEVFGPVPDNSLPSADEFEGFIRNLTTTPEAVEVETELETEPEAEAEKTDDFTEEYLLLDEDMEEEVNDTDTGPDAGHEMDTADSAPARPKSSRSYSVPKQKMGGKSAKRAGKSKPSSKPDIKTPNPRESLPVVNEEDLPEPSLPHARHTDEFKVGQRVLMLVGSELKDAQINMVEAYTHPFLARLPRGVNMQRFEEMTGANADEIAAMRTEAWPKPIVDTMVATPALKNFVPPAGFLRVKPTGEPVGGIIIDSNRSEVIPLKAWARIL